MKDVDRIMKLEVDCEALLNTVDAQRKIIARMIEREEETRELVSKGRDTMARIMDGVEVNLGDD